MDTECESTTEPALSIKPINKNTIHRICSGQVISNLATAVKELLENSIDAGATNIKVKLENYGLDVIEIIDNGQGVERCNFTGLTSKYCTSKITDFSDLKSVSTFGFRGEALSSLCALSTVTIITKHKTAAIATKLEINNEGDILRQIPCAREIGTSVVITDLFSKLPVRRRELERNIKIEYSKLCHTLQTYCLITKGVRVICTNKISNAPTKHIIETTGSNLVLDNISAVFGYKQCESLIEIKQHLEYNQQIRAELFEEYNVNAPEKMNLNSPIEFCNKFQINGFISSCERKMGRSSKDRQFIYINSRPCELKNVSKLINDIYKTFNIHQYPFLVLNILIDPSELDINITPDKRQILINNEEILLLNLKISLTESYKLISATYATNVFHDQSKKVDKPLQSQSEDITFSETMDKNQTQELNANEKKHQTKLINFMNLSTNEIGSDMDNSSNGKAQLNNTNQNTSTNTKLNAETINKELNSTSTIINQPPIELRNLWNSTRKRQVSMSTSIKEIALAMTRNIEIDSKTRKNTKETKFKVSNPTAQNTIAEEELKREISSKDFSKMTIIGQFNLGFIIATLDNDLFIIDQHATDEKYNYETFERTMVLQHQTLVIPESFPCAATSEDILLSNVKLFELNGFKFQIDLNETAMHRIKITAKPHCHGWSFGKEDIDELIFLLQDCPNMVVRPSRIKSMLASRACRKSVMIGTPLSKKEMQRIVYQMENVEYPWTCPHGRPTMRHLFNTSVINKS